MGKEAAATPFFLLLPVVLPFLIFCVYFCVSVFKGAHESVWCGRKLRRERAARAVR
jgi:hypothetical protein